MSKKILVPIDFSPNSNTAIQFAIDLADNQQLSIHLYHNYTVSSANFSQDESSDQEGFKADLLMAELVKSLKEKKGNIDFTSVCETGVITESIEKLSNTGEYLCVIMGTKGKTNDTSVILGSQTYSITQKSSIPVIAIPLDYSLQKIKTVGLLSNFKQEELDTLNEYIKIFGSDFKVKIIHVHYQEESEDDMEELLEVWKYQIKKNTDIKDVEIEVESLNYEVEELDSVPEVINETIKDEEIDIVLITKTRKSFFQRLFTKSVSKEIIHHPIIPTFFSKA